MVTLSVKRRVARSILVAIGVAGAFVAARADLERGLAYFKGGKFLEAAAEFQMLVDRSPDYDYGAYMLGNCMLKMRRPSEAESWFRRALELRSDAAEYYYGLALALRAGGDPAGAVSTLLAAEPHADTADSRFAILSLRGVLLASFNRWSAAVADLEQARSIRVDATVLTALGNGYLALGRSDLAADAFVQAIRIDSLTPEPYRLGAEALLRLAAGATELERKDQLYSDALRLAQEYRRMRPTVVEAANVVGRSALGARRYDIAEEALTEVLRAQPGHCYAMVNLARAFVAREKWGPAETTLRQAAACAPRLAAVWETLGVAYLRQRRSAEALQAFERAEQLRPSTATRSWMDDARRRLDGTAPLEQPVSNGPTR